MLVPMERFEELVKMLEEVYGDVPGARWVEILRSDD